MLDKKYQVVIPVLVGMSLVIDADQFLDGQSVKIDEEFVLHCERWRIAADIRKVGSDERTRVSGGQDSRAADQIAVEDS